MKATFTIIILLLLVLSLSAQLNTWTGTVSRDWQTAGNWSLGHVPDNTENVTIPNGTTFSPLIDDDCECADLTLQSGAEIEIGVCDFYNRLEVYGDFHIHGNVIFSDTTSIVISHQNCYWESGSRAVKNCNVPTSRRPTFYAFGDLFFESGSNVQFDTMSVVMKNTSDGVLRINSPDTRFFILHIDKQNASVTFSASSTEDLVCNVLYINGDPILNSFISLSDQDIIIGSETVGGRLGNYGGTLQLLGGTLRLYAGTIIDAKFSDNDIVNDLEVTALNPYLAVVGSPHILGDLTLYGYPIEFSDHITLEGHLSNLLNDQSTLQFNLLTFEGSNLQSVFQGLDCDTLFVNKPASDVRLLNGIMSCNQYDWVAGGINVLGGTFTADNLVDNGIFGKFWLSPGGIINLTNPDGYVDLNAEIHIYGGTFNIYGGIDNSYWGYAANCILDMDGGVLDFKNRGIRLDDNYNVDDDISGGLIRTSMGFHGASRTDFNPPAGTFEFYGTGDYTINQGSSNTFHHLKVNKGTSDGPEEYQPLLKNSPRSPDDDPPGGGSRSNTLTLASDLNLTGDMVISSGILDVSISDYDIYLQGNWTNTVGDAGFLERENIVMFQGATNSIILTEETFYHLMVYKTSTSPLALQAGNGNGNGVDINVLNTLLLADGVFELNVPCTLSVGDNLEIQSGASLSADDYGDMLIRVGKHWLNSNPPGTGFACGSASVVEFNGTDPDNYQAIKEAGLFNTIRINGSAAGVVPEMSTGFGIIQCWIMEILSGRLWPGTAKVIVENTLYIHDELELSSPTDTLVVYDIIWEAGSTDFITDGRILVERYWTFEDGTDAELDPGNVVEFKEDSYTYIYCFDASSGFGTLEMNKPDAITSKSLYLSSSSQPMRVFGDLTVRDGNYFNIYGDEVYIYGTLFNEAGSEIEIIDTAYLEISGPLDINGTLDIGSGDVLVHDFFDLESTGTLIVDGGSLITDTPTAAPYWCNFKGTLSMTDGIIESTYNNHRFTSTFSGSISGGTFRVGGAFEAADYVFQPSGGTVEFINGGGHILDLGAGNWFHNLHFNNNGSRQLMDMLTVTNDVLITTGGFDCNDYNIYVGGDWTNNAGTSAFVEANGTVYFNGSDPDFAQLISGEFFFDLVNINYDSELQIAGATTITHNFNTGGVGAKTRVTGPSLTVGNLLDLSDATLILAASGPTVEVEDFIQGGMLEVNGGTFTANDLVDSYIKGTYNISGGIVDLSQNTGAGAFVDLKANITMLGGELYVRGGALAYSRWTGVPAPQLTMAPGSVLDFTTAGIYVQDNNFVENISGGLVRCKGMININATNFTPSGGTFEIYGNTNNYVSHLAGSCFHNLKSNLGAAYTLYPLSDLEIKGELKVSSGTFHTNGYSVNLGD